VVDGEEPLTEAKVSFFDIVQSTSVNTLTKFKQKLLADLSLSIFQAIADNAPQFETLDTQKLYSLRTNLCCCLLGNS